MSQPGNPSTEELRRRGKLARKVSPWGRYAACKTKRALESAPDEIWRRVEMHWDIARMSFNTLPLSWKTYADWRVKQATE
jgi:hypothetical protein